MAWYSSLFGSGGGGSSGSGFDWTGALISGISAYSSSRSAGSKDKKDIKLNRELVGLQGIESRKSTQFERELDYYYKQKDKLDKRNALDTYGSFSKLSTYAPDGYALPAKPVVPKYPKV